MLTDVSVDPGVARLSQLHLDRFVLPVQPVQLLQVFASQARGRCSRRGRKRLATHSSGRRTSSWPCLLTVTTAAVKIPIYRGEDRVIPTLRAEMNVYYETEMNQNDLCE